MASVEQIAQLRLNISEPDDIAPYSGADLSDAIDLRGVRLASADIWLAKAAQYAELVDTSEAGSTRPLSSLHKNALAMHQYFLQPEPVIESAPIRGTRSRSAVRV